MRIFLGELHKVLSQKRIWILALAALCVNLFVLQNNTQMTEEGIPPSALKAAYDDMRGLSDEEKLKFIEERYAVLRAISLIEEANRTAEETGVSADEILKATYDKETLASYRELYESGGYLLYSENVYREQQIYSNIASAIAHCKGYAAFLDEIGQKAESMLAVSLFSDPNSFSYRNVIKTAEEMTHLERLELQSDISEGVNTFSDTFVTDLAVFVILLILAGIISVSEHENESIRLIRPTPCGGFPVLLAKIGVYALLCVVITLFFYGVNLFIVAGRFGFGDLSRPIQSVQGFIGSSMQMSVLEYLIFIVSGKVIGFLIVGLLLLALGSVLKKQAAHVLLSVVLMLVSVLLYTSIDPYSLVGIFKYTNLYTLLRSDLLARNYCNINLFEFPVNAIPASLIWMLLVFASSFFVFVLAHFCQWQINLTFWSRRNYARRVLLIPRKVFTNELYKILVANKVAWMLLAFVVLQGALYANPRSFYYEDIDQALYQSYMQELEGPITPQKTQFIEQQRLALEEAEEKQTALFEKVQNGEIDASLLSAALQSDEFAPLRYRNAFDALDEQYQFMQNYEAETGTTLYFIPDKGYRYLFGIDEYADYSILKLLLMTVLCLGGIFAAEYTSGTANLIRPTVLGRNRTALAKIGSGLLITMVLFLITVLPSVFHIVGEYGLNSLNAPIQSLHDFRAVPYAMDILSYFVGMMLVRLFGCLVAATAVLLLSQVCKNLTACAVSAVLLLLTLYLLWTTGAPLTEYSFIALMDGNYMLTRALTDTDFGSGMAISSTGTVLFAIALLGFTVDSFARVRRYRETND